MAAELFSRTPGLPMKTLREAQLYGIVDLGYVAPEKLEETARQMCAGGVDMVQLRAKTATDLEVEEYAQRLAPIFEDGGVPLLINDFPELVPAVGAQGAHVGQDDLGVEEARWRAGRSLAGELPAPIIGKSTHSLEQAVAAETEGADYIGFGPLYATPTKLGRPAIGFSELQEVHRRVSIPIFCIGGIKLENLDAVIAAGARRVVIVSGLLQAPDIAGYCRAARAKLPRLTQD